MFVYSAISWEEIRVLPIFRACVSTWRYRDRRAATPTFKRSATRPPFHFDFVTAFSVVPSRSRRSLVQPPDGGRRGARGRRNGAGRRSPRLGSTRGTPLRARDRRRSPPPATRSPAPLEPRSRRAWRLRRG